MDPDVILCVIVDVILQKRRFYADNKDIVMIRSSNA